MRLQGKTAVVTGGTRGLGRAFAERFLAEGASVICAARNEYDIKELVAADPDRVHFHRTDVTDEGDVAELARFAEQRFGRIDVLVCNAGVSRDGRVGRLSLADWDATVATNLTGVFLCTRAFAEPMTRAGRGRVITVSSCVATRAVVGAAAYGASKAGIESFTRTAALELGPKGITVNCLAPGYIDEGMGRQVSANPKLWETYRSKLALGRLGTPDEVTAAAVFLAGDESGYVNGAVLEVNGGLR